MARQRGSLGGLARRPAVGDRTGGSTNGRFDARRNLRAARTFAQAAGTFLTGDRGSPLVGTFVSAVERTAALEGGAPGVCLCLGVPEHFRHGRMACVADPVRVGRSRRCSGRYRRGGRRWLRGADRCAEFSANASLAARLCPNDRNGERALAASAGRENASSGCEPQRLRLRVRVDRLLAADQGYRGPRRKRPGGPPSGKRRSPGFVCHDGKSPVRSLGASGLPCQSP